MDTKQCARCRERKPKSEFGRNRTKHDGLTDKCKVCNRLYHRLYYKRDEGKKRSSYYQVHKNELRGKRKPLTDSAKQKMKSYYLLNRESIRTKQNEWRKRTGYQNLRYKTDMLFRLRERLRTRLRSALRRYLKGAKSQVSSVRDLGCTIPELVSHLSNQFADGMSWDNYGAWHIDHKRPLVCFNLADKTEALAAVHYANLQPLWSKDNLSKGART